MPISLPADANRIRVIGATSSADGTSVVAIYADPTTHRLKVDASSSLTIGTTTISGGNDTRILYDNAGVVGEYTISGTGSVAMTTSPVFTTPNIGSATGSISGNAGTATALQNARTIGGVSFDGTANITVATATGGFTVSGGDLALGTNSLTLTGSIGSTGSRATKGWFTDLESTNMPTVGGTAILTSLTAPQFTTIELGNASDTTLARVSAGIVSIEGVTIATASNTLTLTNKSIVASQITTGTFGTGAYTMDTSLTVPQIFNADHAIAASSNAATVTRAYRNNVVTNDSAATLTITMSTTSAAGGDMVLVQILDFSAVAQTITWVNTEDSTVTAPTTSNGSTTLPLTVGFKWNTLTSKWRCIGKA